MCVQDVSCGVLSWDVCMFRVVLRPNTEPVDTESGQRKETEKIKMTDWQIEYEIKRNKDSLMEVQDIISF